MDIKYGKRGTSVLLCYLEFKYTNRTDAPFLHNNFLFPFARIITDI